MDYGTEKLEVLWLNPRPLKRGWGKKYEGKKKKKERKPGRVGKGRRLGEGNWRRNWDEMKFCPTSLLMTTSRVTVRSSRSTFSARKPPGSRAGRAEWQGGGVARCWRPLSPAGGAAHTTGTQVPATAWHRSRWGPGGLQGQRAQLRSPVRTDACVFPAHGTKKNCSRGHRERGFVRTPERIKPHLSHPGREQDKYAALRMTWLNSGPKGPTAATRPVAARPLMPAAMRSRRLGRQQRKSYISISFGTHNDSGGTRQESPQVLAGWVENSGSTAPHTAAPEEPRTGEGQTRGGRARHSRKGPSGLGAREARRRALSKGRQNPGL